jgi:hypothetical protein
MPTKIENESPSVSHLAFCALVALHLAYQDGLVASSAGENIYLVRWLSLAAKQRRFPKAVASDIQWLLVQGRKSGPAGKLKQYLEQIWKHDMRQPPTGSVALRLTRVGEYLRAQGWHNAVIPSAEWEIERLAPDLQKHFGFYVEEKSIKVDFSPQGNPINPVPFRVVGDITVFISAMARQDLQVDIDISPAPLGYILAILLPKA